jgi:hypothetical protein
MTRLDRTRLAAVAHETVAVDMSRRGILGHVMPGQTLSLDHSEADTHPQVSHQHQIHRMKELTSLVNTNLIRESVFMAFPNPVASLGLSFGGFSLSSSSPFVSPPPEGTVAGLIVGNIGFTDDFSFQDVGRAFVPLDGDPAADQVIAFGDPGGTPFNFAVFGLFADDSESPRPADAVEVVDNVKFGLAAAVPEPGSLTLFGLGLLVAAVVATRRAAVAARDVPRARKGSEKWRSSGE